MPYQLPAHVTTSDRELLAECDVDTYRSRGPGGQKRNKTESAVRIRHRPTGLSVVATESRSQAENRARALVRLRYALVLSERVPVDADAFRAADYLADVVGSDGRLHVNRRNPRYLGVVQVVLDVFAVAEARVGQAAKLLGFSTGYLVGFLKDDAKLWTQANALRRRFGRKPLR